MACWCAYGSAGENRSVSDFSTPRGTVTIARSTVTDSPESSRRLTRRSSYATRVTTLDTAMSTRSARASSGRRVARPRVGPGRERRGR